MYGFLYTAGSMVDLNSYLNATGTGWTIPQGFDINDFGQILALATDSRSNPYVVLLSPASVTAPLITSLALNPATVQGGVGLKGTSNGAVTLGEPGSGGRSPRLLDQFQYGRSCAQHDPGARGSTTANFAITTDSVAATVSVTITEATGSSRQSAIVTVTPAAGL